MTPSGYEDGKLFSELPTDGSGDFTFSRGSNLAATRVGPTGLIEKGRENLLLQSNSFSDSDWSKTGVTMTSGQSGYDGTNDAWKLEKDAAQYRRVQQTISSVSGVYTYSVYAKEGTLSQVGLRNSGGADRVIFDLSDGTIATQAGNVAHKNIEDIGNGWYRCSATFTDASTGFQVYVDWDESDAGYIFIQDAQAEKGLAATDYIETGASTAQAGILEDMPRLDYSGGASCPALLLEPQRTNFVTDSEYFAGLYLYGSISATYGAYTNPSGNDSAYLLEATSAISRVQTLSSSGDGNSAVISIFIKGNDNVSYPALANNTGGQYTRWEFDANNVLTYYDGDAPSGDYGQEDYGNGWYRIWLKTDTINGSTNYYRFNPDNRYGVGSLYAWGFQVEKNSSYPTSYIPTYGSSVTRSDDFMNISSLADEINGNSFTYFLEVNNEAAVRDASTGNISVGATGNRFFLYNSNAASNRLQLFIQDSGGIEQYVLSADNVKIAIRFEPNNVEVFENGVSVLSTTQNLDFSANSAYVLRGTTREIGIKQTAIFPTALTDSECIALTTI
jgi:hypothetical protein